MNQQLQALGWNTSLEDALRARCAADSVDYLPARVTRQERAGFVLDTGDQQLQGSISGRLKHQAADATSLPVIGDWVLVSEAAKAVGAALINHVLPRRTILTRRRVGNAPDAQPLAANVDLAWVVVGLDRELSLRLIERALALTEAGGVEACLVLTKADLCSDPVERCAHVSKHFPALRVLPISTLSGLGMEALRATLKPFCTNTLVGPSGVGKSSLVNQLLGAPIMRTGVVSSADQKGKHTTTHRQLVRLPDGSLLIDGPGMRELGIWEENGPSDKPRWRRHSPRR